MARIGDSSSEVFFIASGLASVTVPVASGTQKRLGAFSAGMALGEMGFLDRAPRSAAITAETDVECDILILFFDSLPGALPQTGLRTRPWR
jgi:CRP-like cAMP-binding protein